MKRYWQINKLMLWRSKQNLAICETYEIFITSHTPLNSNTRLKDLVRDIGEMGNENLQILDR